MNNIYLDYNARTPNEPFIHGAGHGNGRRAVMENVLLITGLGDVN